MRLCTVAQWDAMNNVGEVMSEDTDPVAALNQGFVKVAGPV
jgi:hypothetical protein